MVIRKLMTFVAALVLILSVAQPAAAAPNPAPAVVPALASWTGGSGSYQLSPAARIAYWPPALRAEAATFQQDLGAIVGRRLPLVAGRARPGDLALTTGPLAGAGAEGYRLTIGDTVTILAPTPTGVSRGAQTVEQLFTLDPRRRAIPRGVSDDRPRAAWRGFMLDAGRHYYQPAYVEQQIRLAAWHKLNVIHFHVTEHNAFRLNSPKFPGLAPAQSYDRADIARFDAIAAKYHVQLLPEIDLPAHATAITGHWPGTTWDCAGMNEERGHNFTMDVTKPLTRDVVKQLLDEFVPWFSSPYFHIGTDEYPYQSTQEQCPELVAYAKAHGFPTTSDVMVDFIDYMNDIVRAHHKTSVIWAWWDRAGTPTTDPAKNILIESYDYDAQHYLDKGYDVLYGNGNQLYVTPGLDLLPDDQKLYQDWPWIDNPRLRGYLISRWADAREDSPDSYHDWYAHRPDTVLADRTWGGPVSGTALDLADRDDRLGPPPGVAGVSPDAVLLNGKPYAGGIELSQPARVSKIRFLSGRVQPGQFEGCTSGPASGCVVLAKVPWDPAVRDWKQLTVDRPERFRWLRYVGPAGVEEVQYFTAPDIGVTASITPPSTLRALGANSTTVTVTNTTNRLLCGIAVDLRAFSAQSGIPLATNGSRQAGCVPPGHSARLTWRVDVPLDVVADDYRLTATASLDGLRTNATALVAAPPPVRTAVAPILLRPGQHGTAHLRITSTIAAPALISWQASQAEGLTVSPRSGRTVLPAGGVADIPIELSVVGNKPGIHVVPIAVSATTGRGTLRLADRIAVSVPYADLAQAFDNVGSTDDAAVNPPSLNGGIDGDGSSLSRQALAAAGATPGGQLSHGGVTFRWPASTAGAPDNAVANGQTVVVGGSGRTLGLLTTATYVAPGTFDGTGTITYTDGTSSTFSVAVPEWQRPYGSPADEAISMSYHNYVPVGQITAATRVFFTGVAIDPARTVASVTLPAGSGGRAALHVFAIGVGS